MTRRMKSVEKVYLALGSNIPPRRAYIAQALFLLGHTPGIRLEAVSEMFENPAQGFEGQEFVNCAARFEVSGISPEQLLLLCKGVERELGRDTSVTFDGKGRRIYRDRPIDIDILLFGRRSVNTAQLTIPHPRMEEREFVMRPLSEIIEDK